MLALSRICKLLKKLAESKGSAKSSNMDKHMPRKNAIKMFAFGVTVLGVSIVALPSFADTFNINSPGTASAIGLNQSSRTVQNEWTNPDLSKFSTIENVTNTTLAAFSAGSTATSITLAADLTNPLTPGGNATFVLVPTAPIVLPIPGVVTGPTTIFVP